MFSEKWLQQTPLAPEEHHHHSLFFHRKPKRQLSQSDNASSADENNRSNSESGMFTSSSLPFLRAKLGKRKRQGSLKPTDKHDGQPHEEGKSTAAGSRPRKKSLKALLADRKSETPALRQQEVGSGLDALHPPLPPSDSLLFSGVGAATDDALDRDDSTVAAEEAHDRASSQTSTSSQENHGVAIIQTPPPRRTGAELLANSGERTPPLPDYAVNLIRLFDEGEAPHAEGNTTVESPNSKGHTSPFSFQRLRRKGKLNERSPPVARRDWFAAPASAAIPDERKRKRVKEEAGAVGDGGVLKRRLSGWRD